MERIGRKTIYQSKWVNLHVDQVRMPSGKVIDEHHLLAFDQESVACVVENARNEVLFVRAYRYPTNSVEWEIPAGGIDGAENAIAAAQREVLEETGCHITGARLLYSYHPSNGISDQCFHIVCATLDESQPPATGFDVDEVEGMAWIPVDRIRSMVAGNGILDGLTLTALLLYLGFHAARA